MACSGIYKSSETARDVDGYPVDRASTLTVGCDDSCGGAAVSKPWLYQPAAVSLCCGDDGGASRTPATVEDFDLMTTATMTLASEFDDIDEAIQMEAMRLMAGGEAGCDDAEIKAVGAKIRHILEDKLADRGVHSTFTQEIVEKKLHSILSKVKTGVGSPRTAVQEARLWHSVLENSKKVREDALEQEGEDVCDDETEEVQQYVQPREIEKRLPLGDAMASITYRDQYYEQIAYEHNSKLGLTIGPQVDDYNKKRAQVNDLVDEHNYLIDRLPSERANLEKKRKEYQVKAKEWEEMQKSFANWPQEKEELLFQLDTLHDELLDAEAENTKLHTLSESLNDTVGRHQDALQVLKTLPAEVQEYYKKILRYSNEIAEANDKIEEMQSTYWDFMGLVEKLTDAMLKLEIIPATTLFVAENFNKSFVANAWREAGLKPGRIPAVQNKIANSVRMAKRLSVILERARKSEKRVLKGLSF